MFASSPMNFSHLLIHVLDLFRHELISTFSWEAVKTNIGAAPWQVTAGAVASYFVLPRVKKRADAWLAGHLAVHHQAITQMFERHVAELHRHIDKGDPMTELSLSQRLPGLRGKQPAKSSSLRFAHEYVKAGSQFEALLSSPPLSADVSGQITDWGMLANGPDPSLTPPRVPVGDCTFAARQHNRMAKAAAAGTLSTETWETSDELEDEYLVYNNGVDQGANIADLLLAWYKAGKILGFAPIDPTNRDAFNAAMIAFHGNYVGVQLTPDADPRFSQHVPWSVANGQQPDPNEGHCIVRVKYDPSLDTYITWGAEQPAEIDGTALCADESYIIITSEDEAANMDMAALIADIEATPGGEVAPAPVPEPAPAPAPIVPVPDVTPPAPAPQPEPVIPPASAPVEPPVPAPVPSPDPLSDILLELRNVGLLVIKAIEDHLGL